MSLSSGFKNVYILNFVGNTVSYRDSYAVGFRTEGLLGCPQFLNVGSLIFNCCGASIGAVMFFSNFYSFTFNCFPCSFNLGFSLFALGRSSIYTYYVTNKFNVKLGGMARFDSTRLYFVD